MTQVLTDRTLMIVSVILAMAGIILLAFVAPDAEQNQFVLTGTVSEVHGRQATVTASVQLIGKNLSAGKEIRRKAFWNGEAFVATE
jgi:hypothetical protein